MNNYDDRDEYSHLKDDVGQSSSGCVLLFIFGLFIFGLIIFGLIIFGLIKTFFL